MDAERNKEVVSALVGPFYDFDRAGTDTMCEDKYSLLVLTIELQM